jgi:hypothetical protein
VQAQRFCWRLESIDWKGPWGWERVTVPDLLGLIIPRLHSYESMTWAEVEGRTKSHFVDYDTLCPEAQARLTTELEMDEQARLFSVRIGARQRVWGRRDVAILRVLWWDPEHTVCPSLKD